MRENGENGFTLVEVLIALVLFSLIGIAGFSLLSAVVGVQARTDERLDRLAEMQRAMHLMALDFQQIAAPPLQVENGAATLRRSTRSNASGALVVRYDLDRGNLRRTLARGGTGSDQEQVLVPDVAALKWMFFDKGAWTDNWPPPGPDGDRRLPLAISMEVDVKSRAGGLAGTLRRIVRLPTESGR